MAGFRVAVTLILAFATTFYTALAGIPASIITDKIQGIMIIGLVFLLALALTTQPENYITRDQFDRASNWTGQGMKAFVTLTLALASSEMFNQSSWQRVWAAESVPAMRKGFLIGSVLVFSLMMFFVIMGMIGKCGLVVAYAPFVVVSTTIDHTSYLNIAYLVLT
jgi:solute:Na+ symporter, SSS family